MEVKSVFGDTWVASWYMLVLSGDSQSQRKKTSNGGFLGRRAVKTQTCPRQMGMETGLQSDTWSIWGSPRERCCTEDPSRGTSAKGLKPTLDSASSLPPSLQQRERWTRRKGGISSFPSKDYVERELQKSRN